MYLYACMSFCECWCTKIETDDISLKSWSRHVLLDKSQQWYFWNTYPILLLVLEGISMLVPHLLMKKFWFLWILSSTFNLLCFESNYAQMYNDTCFASISLMMSFCWELSIELFAIYVPPLEKCLFKSFNNFFFVLLAFSTLWICRILLYTLEINYIN